MKEIVAAFRDWFLFFADHRAAINAIFREDWEIVTEPNKFFGVMVSLYFAIVLLGTSWTSPTWTAAFLGLNEDEQVAFLKSLNIELSYDEFMREVIHPGSTSLSNQVRAVAGSTQPENIADYFSSIGNNEIAFKLYKAQGKESRRIEYTKTAIELIYPFILILQYSLVHRLLKSRSKSRSKIETRYIVTYYIGFTIPVLAVTETLTWHFSENDKTVMLATFFISIALFFKQLFVFQYSHNTTVPRLIGADLVVGAVLTIIMLLMAAILNLVFIYIL